MGFWNSPGNPGGEGLKKYPVSHVRVRNSPSFVAVPLCGLVMFLQVEPESRNVKKVRNCQKQKAFFAILEKKEAIV